MDDNIVVETTAGRLKGRRVANGVRAFLGVPFGADTAGKNRFRPPQPAPAWSGIREAHHFGPYCPQVNQNLPAEDAHSIAGLAARPGEDCLNLNIWAPRDNGEGARAVIVWLHAGGFSLGSTAHPLTDGARLAAENDVVVVSIGHRLGVLGYLLLDDLARDEDSANLGLRDIVLGLEWVRDNIAGFGGNPDCVTLCGASGGGRKISMLMAMATARGLFHHAIIQSGAHPQGIARAAATRFAEALARSLSGGGDPVGVLRALPVDRLCAEGLSFALRWPAGDPDIAAGQGVWAMSPVEDGQVVPVNPWEKMAPRVSQDIPLMIGTTRDEAALHLTRQTHTHGIGWAELEETCIAAMGEAGPAVLAACRKLRPGATPWQILVAVAGGDRRALSIEMAEAREAAGGAATYMYVVDWASALPRFGAPHMIDIPLLFGTVDDTPMSGGTAGRHDMSAQFRTLWCSFARTGRPAAPGLPSWPRYAARHRSTMHLDTRCWVENDPLSAERLAWSARPCPMPWENGGFTGRTRLVVPPQGETGMRDDPR